MQWDMNEPEGKAFWSAIRARVEVIADTLGLHESEVDAATVEKDMEDLIAFAERHRQSVDWIALGDVRAYLRAGLSGSPDRRHRVSTRR